MTTTQIVIDLLQNLAISALFVTLVVHIRRKR